MGIFSHDEMDSYYDTKDTLTAPELNALARFAQMPEGEIKKAIARHIRNEITKNGGFSLSLYGIYSPRIPITSYSDTVVEVLRSGMSEEENKCLGLYIYWLKKSLCKTPIIRNCVLVLDYEQIEKEWFSECQKCYIPHPEYISKLSEEKKAFLEKIKNQSLESLVCEMEEESRIERERISKEANEKLERTIKAWKDKK